MTYTDSVKAPSFTGLFFALGEFNVQSQARIAVDKGSGQFVLGLDQWRVEITGEYDWDAARWALIPGIGRETFAEVLALQKAGYGRRLPGSVRGRNDHRPRDHGGPRRSPRGTIEAVIRPREKSCCRRPGSAADSTARTYGGNWGRRCASSKPAKGDVLARGRAARQTQTPARCRVAPY